MARRFGDNVALEWASRRLESFEEQRPAIRESYPALFDALEDQMRYVARTSADAGTLACRATHRVGGAATNSAL